MNQVKKYVGLLVAILASIVFSIGITNPATADTLPASSSAAPVSAAAQDNTIRYSGRTLDASTGQGITVTKLPGDSIQISGESFSIVDGSGNTVITLSTTLPTNTKLSYDEYSGQVDVVSTASRIKSCTNNKWAKWLVRTFGGVFVCTPAFLGSMGLGGPVVAAFFAGGCAGGIEGLVTAISC